MKLGKDFLDMWIDVELETPPVGVGVFVIIRSGQIIRSVYHGNSHWGNSNVTHWYKWESK